MKKFDFAGDKRDPTTPLSPNICPTAPFGLYAWPQPFCSRIRHQPLSLMSRNFGLHPYAIEILAELISATSQKTQVIISTQSPALVDYFEPNDIIVVNREKGASVFKRLNEEELSTWLEDYSLGELWRKNIVAGGPSHE